jgi:hypothetical protein
LRFWTGRSVSRTRFLERVLAELDRQGWQHRADTGWSDFDIEIHGSRWTRLQLLTAVEYSKDDNQTIHCRLRTAWTLLAKASFWGFLGLTLVVISLLEEYRSWTWMLLLLLPGLVMWLHEDQLQLRRVVCRFLSRMAQDLGMKRLDPTPPPVEGTSGPAK